MKNLFHFSLMIFILIMGFFIFKSLPNAIDYELDKAENYHKEIMIQRANK